MAGVCFYGCPSYQYEPINTEIYESSAHNVHHGDVVWAFAYASSYPDHFTNALTAHLRIGKDRNDTSRIYIMPRSTRALNKSNVESVTMPDDMKVRMRLQLPKDGTDGVIVSFAIPDSLKVGDYFYEMAIRDTAETIVTPANFSFTVQ